MCSCGCRPERNGVKQLEAFELQINKIFCSDYDFRIPDYQRQYAWGTDEALQLLDDLSDSLERDVGEPYFLGSIVLVKEKGVPTAQIIDGQQRLTTLTILFAVLRDLAKDPDLAREIQAKISEPGQKLMGLEPKPRLALRHRDRAFFRKYIQEVGNIDGLSQLTDVALPTDAQKNIRDNAIALRTVLSGWPEDRRAQLASMLSARTFLVVVSTPDLESAHRIFSVMNSRGLDLSPADIFKADTIGAVPGGESEDYTEKWEDAEQELGRELFSDLFLHIRLIHTKRRSEQNLLREFPEQVLNSYLPDRAKEFVDDVVVPYARAYDQITRTAYTAAHGADRVNAWFKRLAQLNTNDWQAPALWAIRTHGDDPVWLEKFFARLERLAASMFIRRVYVTPRLLRYIDLLRQLDAGDGLHAAAFELSDEEKANTREALNGDVYLVTKTRKYVLLRLDETLANSPGVTYDHAVVTVEHVLPQNPKADSYWVFTDDQRERWTHRIANLLLLNRVKNAEAQNYEFDKKKIRYFQSSKGVATFALTSQVLQEPVWTPEVLERRQKDLLEILTRLWALQ